MSHERHEVLHYIGADNDRGGIVSVVRALASADRFACVLGLNCGGVQERKPPLASLEFPPLAGERLGLQTFWRARAVAKQVRAWLAADRRRVFHAHSRAGLAVALRLRAKGETRVVVSVHCYGHRPWFYRWAAGQLGDRLYWLSPTMKRYYQIADPESWRQCVPGCVPARAADPATARRRSAHDVVRLGGVGMIVSWKRWHLVLDALALLPNATRSRLRFQHIGAPDNSDASRRYAAALQAKTIALGLASITEWRGEQPGADAFLREIDCLVVASMHEPFSVAMLEALSAGVPIVAARSGGACDVLTPTQNGWFFEPDETGDLARVLEMLVESDALEKAKVAPADVERFDARVVAAQWAEIYADVAEP